MTGQPPPDETGGLVLRVVLPPALEALRLRHVPNAREGVPAHVTLAFPFAGADDPRIRETIAATVARHRAWTMRLVEQRAWPDTLYVSVEPEAPVRSLHEELVAALPVAAEPAPLPFVPHVTVAVGAAATDDAVTTDPAWDTLPVSCPIDEVEMLVVRQGRWTTAGRWPLEPRT